MRFVQSKSPVAGAHKKLGKFSIKVEVPQVESVNEFITFAGGDDKALTFINRAIETAAKNGGRAKARNLGDETLPPAIAEGGEEYVGIQETVKKYTPGTTREGGITAKKGKEIANTLAAQLADPNKKTFTADEIRALLEASAK